jgi:hypothetical protein
VSYSSSITASGAGLPQTLRAEWTKLRSLRSTWICVVLVIGLTALMPFLAASGSSTSANDVDPPRAFGVQLVHRSLAGDGSIVTRVVSQEDTGPDAKAGLLITGPVSDPGPGVIIGKPAGKDGEGQERQPYAAIMVTPGHGVRWQADFATPIAGSSGRLPLWLKLTRHGSTVTGYESRDGATWTKVGSAVVPELTPTAEVGMFVTSPATGTKSVRRSAGSTESGPDYTLSTAVFNSVRVADPAGNPLNGPWLHLDTAGAPLELPHDRVAGSFTEQNGTFTISGAGELGIVKLQPDDDTIRDALNGILIGFITMAVVGALFITTEFRRGLIRTTFTANPRRGLVLTAKCLVLAAVSFMTGAVAATVAVAVSQPLFRDHGYTPPAYPSVSIWDGPVLRAVLGTGLLLALLAVFALALGTLLRRSAGALTLIIGLVLLPFIIGPFLTLGGEAWLKRLTPGIGFAIQQTQERFDDVVAPWVGLGVLCGWVAVALALAYARLRRQDV